MKKPAKKQLPEIENERTEVLMMRNIRRGLLRMNGSCPPESESPAIQYETAVATPSQPAKVPETYSVAEASAILKVTPATIYRLIQRGKLRYLKSLRHKRIPKAELERFMKQDLG